MNNYDGVLPYEGEEGTKREQVERMFDHISPTYDSLNHTLSMGIDRRWRRAAIDFLQQNSRLKPDQVLDVATGTGDFAILAQRQLGAAHVTGIDISEGMMRIGQAKVKKLGLDGRISFQKEDCSQMSFPDNTFDAIISAFGLRNFEHLDQCLAEMRRVLKPGGRIVAIDLCTPTRFPMKQLFWVYKKCVMPVVGRCISHDDKAYTYLPTSMDAIPQGSRMTAIFQKAGFHAASFRRMPLGICMLYSGLKADEEQAPKTAPEKA